MSGVLLLLCAAISASPATVELRRDNDAEKVDVVVDGREVLSYQHGQKFATPHYWPVRSPSGKLLTKQVPDPFPHHRSLWIADKVQAKDAPAVDFYHCWKNYRTADQPDSGFRHFIRHQRFGELKASGNIARLEATLQWIVDETRPILDDHRSLRVIALGGGEYLIDLQWRLTASYGEVKFASDSVHYAWPYVRIHPQFSGERGGIITSDQGLNGQTGTHDQVAKWIDFSNTVDGDVEGLAVFIYPDGKPHRWLTREYGTFGPRRSDDLSGTGFTLGTGESIQGRVGILVHRGNCETGRVSERYQEYVEGKL